MEGQSKYSLEKLIDSDDQTILDLLKYPNKATPEILKTAKIIAKQRNLLKEETLNEFDLKAATFSDTQIINVITNHKITDIRLVKAASDEAKRRGIQLSNKINIDFSDPQIMRDLEEKTKKDRRLFFSVISVIFTIIVLGLKLINQ